MKPVDLPRLACLALIAALAARAQEVRSEMVPTQLVENGVPIELELVFHRPAGPGPYPTVVFNHGSTGTGSDPATFTQTWTSVNAGRFFNDRGWMVVFPQRRGRGRSGGLYDEGFAADRSGYTCDPVRSLAGMERALTDLDEVIRHLRSRAEVDASRLLAGGQSRGGILSIVHAGTRLGVYVGVVNFVGGWMSDQCPNVAAINPVAFARGGAFAGPTLWLYGENDSFYRMTHSQGNFATFTAAGGAGEFRTFVPPAGQNGHFILGFPSLWESTLADFLAQVPGGRPVVAAVSGGGAIEPAGAVQLGLTGAGVPSAMQWSVNGLPITGANEATLGLADFQPDRAGLYQAAVTYGGSTVQAAPLAMGLRLAGKAHGDGREVGADILHPNGNRYDQYLLEGAAVALRADAGQVTRVSFVDLSDDIVQVEFSGAGTLTLVLDGAAGPAAPRLYSQPGVAYMKGHAGIVVMDADETTNLSVFSVGRANAVNQALFRDDAEYDGVADVAYVAIASRNGRFGGLRTANTHYWAARGVTGVHAPGVEFTGPVYVGDLTAHGDAEPVLELGSASEVLVAGGSLAQANGRPVRVAGIDLLRFGEGRTSHGGVLPAQSNLGSLRRGGVDVTQLIVSGP